jgi:hypothetical protein
MARLLVAWRNRSKIALAEQIRAVIAVDAVYPTPSGLAQRRVGTRQMVVQPSGEPDGLALIILRLARS